MQLSKLIYTNIFWRGINMVSVFVLNLLISQLFGAEKYGDLFYFINTLSFAVLLLSLSLDSGFTFYNSKSELNASGAIWFAFFWSMLAGVVASLFILVYNKMGSHNYSELHAFMYVTGMLLLVLFTALFNAKHHYVWQNLTIAIVNIILAVSLFAIKNNFEHFVRLFFIAVFVQGLIMGVGYVLIYVKTIQFTFLTKPALLKIFKYSLVAFLGNIIFFLVYRIDYWFVDYFVKDKVQLGNYIQVSKVGQLFFIIPSIVASTVFAVTAEGKKENMQQKVIRLSKILFIGTLLLCLPLVFWGKWIFPFGFGETFVYMYKPFLLLLPGILFLAAQSPFSAYNGGMHRLKYNLMATGIALMIIIIGDVIFIPKYGINAAAAVCSIGYCACALFLGIIFYQQKSEAE
jgi:O-antigen/teichoic acid export membrane protein